MKRRTVFAHLVSTAAAIDKAMMAAATCPGISGGELLRIRTEQLRLHELVAWMRPQPEKKK